MKAGEGASVIARGDARRLPLADACVDAPYSVDTRKGGTGASVIVRGDARNLPLADASVDLIVTSPP